MCRLLGAARAGPVNLDFRDEQELLRRSLRELLAAEWGRATMREHLDRGGALPLDL